MLRNLSRTLLILGAALLAAVPALPAQSAAAGPVRGDVDGDGRVTAADAGIVADFLVGKTVPSPASVLERGDANGDGKITSVDVAIMRAFAAGRNVSRFGVGAPLPELPGNAIAAVVCRGDFRTKTLVCDAPSGAAGGVKGILIGGQHQFVELTSSNIGTTLAGDFTFDVTVGNLTPQKLGTTDGTTAAVDSVRVFFATPPTVDGVGDTGSMTVEDADSGTFTATNQHFYQYPAPLNPGATSPVRQWHFKKTGNVTHFQFLVYVAAQVQYNPGWVDIYPPAHTKSPYFFGSNELSQGQTLQLVDSVRTPVGTYVPGDNVTWASSNPAVATVNSTTGLVTAVADGVDTVTATSNAGRTGRVEIVVSTASAANSVISGTSPVAAGDTSIITVQLKNTLGVNYTHSGGTVVLTTNLGTLKSGAGTGASVTADDNGNGTYTAKLTSTTSGTATVSGTLNGNPIGTSATVVFNPGAPADIIKTAGDGQTGTAGNAVAIAPTVHVVDMFGNAVPGATLNFTVIGGGGSTTAASPVTDASGNAAVGSWTLGSGPTTNKLQVAATTGTAAPDTFTAYIPPVAATDSSQAMGNTTLSTSVAPNVLANDATINGGAITITTTGALLTVRNGTVNLNADGTFSYLPPAGNVLRDSVQYTINDTHVSASGYIKLRFVGKVWYVDNSGANGDGRDVSPFSSITNAEVSAGTNDSILVRTGSGTTAGGTLKNGQLLRGQGQSAAFTTTLNGIGVTLLPTGSAPNIGALTLGSGNTLRGFTGTGGITGTNFGTLTVSEVALNNTSGQALSVNNGTLSAGFTSVQSNGGTNNVSLTNVATSGTVTLGTAGDVLTGATGDGVVVSGGSGSFTFPANITNAGVATSAVNVNGKTGGTVTFSGNLNPAGAARGISVTGNNSGANTIVFSGTAKNINTPVGVGVNLSNNTGATIQFTNGGLAVTSGTGSGFVASGGGTVEVSGSGNTVSTTGAARAVDLDGVTIGANGIGFASITGAGTTSSAFRANSVNNSGGGAFTAASLTVTSTTGASSRGIELTSNSAPFTFTTVSVNNTGGEGIYLTGNTAAVAINGGTVGNTTSTGGDALFVSGGNAGVTVAASLTKSTGGRIANIGSRTGGTTTVSGNLSCTGSCTGISATSNSGGTIDFSAGTKTLTTGASAAVTLTNNTGSTINFSNDGLAISTTSGAGFNATGGGTVTVQGSTNTVSTGTGVAVNVANTTIGASGMTFKSVSAALANSGANGIVLNNTGSGAFTVTGDGASDQANTTRGRTTAKSGGGTLTLGSGGTISSATGDGVSLTSTGAVTLRNMVIQNDAGDGVQATTVSGLTIDNSRITGHTNNSGLFLTSVSAPVIIHSEIENNAFGAGAPSADIENVRLISNTGTGSVSSSVIANTSAGAERQLHIFSTTGTLNISVTNSRIGGSTVGDGVGVYAYGSSNITANFQNDSVHSNSSFGIDSGTETTQSSSLNITVNNTALRDNFLGVAVAHGSSGTNTFSITNNNFQTTVSGSSSAININRLAGASFTSFGLFSGTVSGNTIGTSGVANSGSDAGDGITVKTNGNGGTTRVSILNNTIRRYGQHGIALLARDATTGHTLHARVQNNNIAEGEAVVSQDGINVTMGALNTDVISMCLDIGGAGGANGNTVTSAVRNGIRVRSSGLPAANVTLTAPAYDGTGATYFANRNPLATGASGNTSFSNASGTTSAGSCTTP